MEKSKSLNVDESKIVIGSVVRFKKLIKGHEHLLEAIGKI